MNCQQEQNRNSESEFRLRLKCADPTGPYKAAIRAQEDMHVALPRLTLSWWHYLGSHVSLFLWRCEIDHTDLVGTLCGCTATTLLSKRIKNKNEAPGLAVSVPPVCDLVLSALLSILVHSQPDHQYIVVS